MKNFCAFILLAAASAVPSLASTVYQGSDTACFYFLSSCTPTSSTSDIGFPSTVLSYTPDSGFSAGASGGQVELGTFSVGTSPGGEIGTFDLDISFTKPGDGSDTYSAATLGAVVSDGFGGVLITFDSPTTQLYNTSGGSFDVSLPTSTIDIAAGHSYNLYATITPLTATPEPASVATVVSGLMFLGIIVYRRRTAKAASL